MVYHRSDGDNTPSARDRAPPSAQSKPEAPQLNAFRNDGSFLEMFKRMQEASASGTSSTASASKELPSATTASPVKDEHRHSVVTAEAECASPSGTLGNVSSGDESSKDCAKRLPLVGKRRGGRVLPTGVVKKKRTDEEGSDEKPKDAWSLYMAEVKRYKETSCEEDGKTRPLVKLIMPPALVEWYVDKLKNGKPTPPGGHAVGVDSRFPNQNQTRHCYQMYLDYHRCVKKRGESYEPCNYFQHAYKTLCPQFWVEKWDEQIENDTFPGNI